MNRDELLDKALILVLSGLKEFGPEPLLPDVEFQLAKSGNTTDEAEVTDCLTGDDPNSRVVTEFRIALATWDADSDGGWNANTSPGSLPRRTLILELLGFSLDASQKITEAHPPMLDRDVFIEDPDWTPWYTGERRRQHVFYWHEYQKLLRDKLGAAAVSKIDLATTNIVSRLADPCAKTPYQAKGLVVGHVQSGKTSNFTGVIAKAIDAGYRLVIVLTGTVELLRIQTQRRLDMELIGKENILGGRDESDFNAVSDVDYVGDGDSDWAGGKFVSHGIDFSTQPGVPAIRRLTGKAYDYNSLQAGLDALDPRSGNELRDPRKAVWHPDNLFETDVRVAVVKKNKAVLTKLVRDLNNVRARLDEIPVLIIDDEADQASVNTVNPRTSDRTRTAINALIAELLGKLKRSQYVGYTATPFANVFVSPEDSEDIFPKDFILSLEPPPEYMGGASFHDLDLLDPEDPKAPGISNESAFVRDLVATSKDEEDKELREAIIAFVLTGAVKLWRVASGHKVPIRHHTMLVHESVKQIEHKELAAKISNVWVDIGFSESRGLVELQALFESDFRVVSESRSWEAPLPAQFSELHGFIGQAVDLITVAGKPVVVVNGDKDNEYEQVDFDTGRVWRILVGGTKLSRGFTIEGLTVTYYRRKSQQADSLMQMGRWFGYRPGHRDLVRLYIARNLTPNSGGRSFDLYDAFQAIVEDEEAFREQLRDFDGVDESGAPNLRPIDVPPMVFQQLPWLKPTSTNKMYNAELTLMGEGGKLRDFTRQPARGAGENNKAHLELVTNWVSRLGDLKTFEYSDRISGRTGTYQARVVIVDAAEVLEVLSRFTWVDGFEFGPNLQMMRQAINAGSLTDWAILVPHLGLPESIRTVGDIEIPIIKRSRRNGRNDFSGSSFRQRAAIQRIAGDQDSRGGIVADTLHTPTRGAILLTFAHDPADGAGREVAELANPARPEDIATLFSFALPKAAARTARIGFRVRKRGAGAIITRPE